MPAWPDRRRLVPVLLLLVLVVGLAAGCEGLLEDVGGGGGSGAGRPGRRPT